MARILRRLIYLAVLTIPSAASSAPASLKVLTWAAYTDPEVVSEFEDRFDTRVEMVYFESDAERDEKLAVRGGRGYDLMLVNVLQLERYAKRDWIEPITDVDVPNRALIDPRWNRSFDGAGRWGVPYFWGTMGIVYRSDLHPAGFTSWKQLLDPEPALHGRVMMPDFVRESMGAALMSLGQSVNTADRAQIGLAGDILMAQKPAVRHYRYPSIEADSVLLGDDIVAAMLYGGDIFMLLEREPDLRFVIPEEGGLLFVDYLAVSAFSERKALAFEFVNFLNEPDIAARQARYVSYPSPNTGAADFLSAEFLSDPNIYPPADVLERSEFILSLPPRSQKLMNTIGQRLSARP